jgi:hypothetical protein
VHERSVSVAENYPVVARKRTNFLLLGLHVDLENGSKRRCISTELYSVSSYSVVLLIGSALRISNPVYSFCYRNFLCVVQTNRATLRNPCDAHTLMAFANEAVAVEM